MELTIDNKNGKKIYNVRFSSLTDLYNYLKNKPKINRKVFNELASEDEDTEFYGEPLNKSIEYILGGYKKGLNNFLEISNTLRAATKDTTDNRKMERGFYGGIPLSPLVAAGVPDCMLRYERVSKETLRNIYFSLTYHCGTTQEEIINRGLIILYIIDCFERRGEIVNFRASEFSICDDEIINIEIVMKKPGDMFLDVEKCYYPIAAREFLRRILFRVLETMPVKNDWSSGYGQPLSSDQIRNIFNVPTSDIIVPQPSELNIYGNNIYNDAISTLNSLNLQDEFDIEKIKKLSLEYDNK